MWLAFWFRDDLVIAVAMMLEISGVTLLAIEVLTGHEAERYDGDMTAALEVESLYQIDKWQFLVSTLSVVPAALRRADAEIASLNPPGQTAHWATSGNKALIAANLHTSNLESINAAGGILQAIGREASPSPEKLHESARRVHDWLEELFGEATEWRNRRKDQVFASRRWRLFGGVVLIVLGAVLHSWHLIELHLT